MNRETIVNILNEIGDLNHNPDYANWESDANELVYALENTYKPLERPTGTTVEVVERFGGEDQGREYWAVLRITHGEEEVHIKFNGWYASYDGGYLDDPNFDIVEKRPVQSYEWSKV